MAARTGCPPRPPPAHAALAVKDGPVVPSTLTRFADTVDAISFGMTVGAIRRAFFVSLSLCSISRCVWTSPAPLLTTTASSRVGTPDCASACRAAFSAMSEPRPMKRDCSLAMPSSAGSRLPG